MRKPSRDSAVERRTALFLAPEAPYPLAGGGALRAASVLEFLARHYTVDAIIFRQPGSPDPAGSLPGIVRDLSVIDLRHHARHALARVTRNARRLARRAPPLIDRFAGYDAEIAAALRGRTYDVAVVEHFWCAPYFTQIAAHCKRIVLDLHNVESAWHEGQAKASPPARAVAYSVFQQASLGLERAWLPRFSVILAASPDDARRVGVIAPGSRVEVYPNSIPLVERPRCAERDVIAFSGTFDYDPNRLAVRYFRREIWPTLRARHPHLRWRLVGRNAEAVRRYTEGDPRIECTGAIDDPVKELARAKVVVVPLLSGSGTRLKIIEAWAAGRAVVSTQIGAEGLRATHGRNIMIESGADSFSGTVSQLLENPSLRNRLGDAGRSLYEEEFTWQATWKRLAAVFDTLY